MTPNALQKELENRLLLGEVLKRSPYIVDFTVFHDYESASGPLRWASIEMTRHDGTQFNYAVDGTDDVDGGWRNLLDALALYQNVLAPEDVERFSQPIQIHAATDEALSALNAHAFGLKDLGSDTQAEGESVEAMTLDQENNVINNKLADREQDVSIRDDHKSGFHTDIHGGCSLCPN